jgi:hypothetical protein
VRCRTHSGGCLEVTILETYRRHFTHLLWRASQCQQVTSATAPTGGGEPVKLRTIGRVLCPTVVTQRRTNSDNRAVTAMALATATSAFESHFDSFLYAAVSEEPDRAPLTVLSVLARLDIDPWQEAARLAQLPREAGVRVLARLISALPEGATMPADSGTIAARLITLLPRRPERPTTQRVSSGAPRVIRIPNLTSMIARAILSLLLLGLLLLGQWIAMSHLASLPAKKPLAAPATTVAASAEGSRAPP